MKTRDEVIMLCEDAGREWRDARWEVTLCEQKLAEARKREQQAVAHLLDAEQAFRVYLISD